MLTKSNYAATLNSVYQAKGNYVVAEDGKGLFSGSYNDLTDKPTIPSVIANPTLSGNEATLNGLEVDGTKYKVGGGSGGSEVHLYQHLIEFRGGNGSVYAKYYDTVATPYEITTFANAYGVGGAEIQTSTEVKNDKILYKCSFQESYIYNIYVHYITLTDATPKKEFIHGITDTVRKIF